MLTLYVLRHAKSSWADAGADDFDRPLNERGERAAAAMAAYCRQKGVAPDQVFCSPAMRTRQTWSHISEALPTPKAVDFPERGYGAEATTWLDIVSGADPTSASIMIIGHNPGLQKLAYVLTREGAIRAGFPTCALATITSDAPTWASFAKSAVSLADFATPKGLV